jgi:hypothetical protein
MLAWVPAARAAEVRFSPAPPMAGQPFQVIYRGAASGCGEEGQLTLDRIIANHIFLTVVAANCPVLPTGFVEYTATAIVGPLAAGSYLVVVSEEVGAQVPVAVHVAEALEVQEPPVCVVTATSLCLGGRFEVTGDWTDFAQRSGPMQALADGFHGLGDWGVLWFFSPENPELVVKALDGCAVNGHHWIFVSPASTVEYLVQVRDVRSGAVRTYANALGALPELFADTEAFPCS